MAVPTNGGDDADLEEDPFGMFGEEGNDSETEGDNHDVNYDDYRNSTTTATTTTRRRDPDNGFNRYHPGTECAMLQHVRNGLSTTAITTPTASRSAIESVLSLVDEFCLRRHWMMHIGTEKGSLLVNFLEQRLDTFIAASTQADNIGVADQTTFVILEVGTYCGYSSALLARTLLEKLGKACSWHIITVDVDPLHSKVAQQLHQLAGLPLSCFSYLLLDDGGSGGLSTIVKSELLEKFSSAAGHKVIPAVNFVFLDHDKDLYLPDLQKLEHAGLIRAECAVAADNVVFFRLHEYTSYMQQRAREGIVSTQTLLGRVEYMPDDDHGIESDWQDGLELSIYLKDPPF